jgi:hypothetical protein
MSIVSGLNDIMKVSVKKQPTNAVQWGQDVVPDVENAPQLPTINQFRKIRVPSTNPRAPPKGCDIPVKFKQEDDGYQRPETEIFETTKLKPFQPNFDTTLRQLIEGRKELEADTYIYDYNRQGRSGALAYELGIKPAPRAIKFSQISEPTPAMYRP